MNGPSLQEQIEAAKVYDSLYLPALFDQWATKVADAANIQSGQRVLDVACGTGVLSREVASRVTPSGYIAGLDPSPGMLAVGKELAPEIDWKQGVAEPFSIRFRSTATGCATLRRKASTALPRSSAAPGNTCL